MDRTDPQHRLARTGVILVISTVPPIPPQPGEGSFHHPPPRRLYPSLRPRGATHHLDPIPGPGPRQPPPEMVVVVLPIGPHQLRPTAVLDGQPPQHLGCERPVVAGGCRDHHDEQQPQRIDDDMPLPAPELLAPVVTPFASDLGPLDRLAVDAPGTWTRL